MADSKEDLIRSIHELLKGQLERASRAFEESRSYATDPDSKAESKYDTRSLEASYLAAGQADAVEVLERGVEIFTGLTLPSFTEDDEVGAGALVEADVDNELCFYLLAPAGGGIKTTHLGCDLSVLTPDAPLYQSLLGKRCGDVVGDICVLDVI